MTNAEAFKRMVQHLAEKHSCQFIDCSSDDKLRVIIKNVFCFGESTIKIFSTMPNHVFGCTGIIDSAKFYPMIGKSKVYLFDECFAKGTKVITESGIVNIENIKVGDSVKNLFGFSKVKNVFINKVALDRLLLVKLNSGIKLYCSEDHLFLTSSGWVKAKNLTENLSLFRYWKQEIEIGNRSRWESSFDEKTQIERQEKRKQVKRIRVEDIEVYKQGSNDESFKCVIGDKEKSQKYVELHDLEIDDHPSYTANGILVHNCHSMTRESQNALLKLIEDYPSHCYFILCSTNPEKIINTIKTRCSRYEVSLLNNNQIFKLLSRVCKSENIKIKDDIMDLIVDNCGGVPRTALVLLDQLKGIKKIDRAKKLILDELYTAEVIDLCRAVLNSEWNNVLKIFNSIDGLDNNSAEKIRINIYGYLVGCLKNSRGNNDRERIIDMLNVMVDELSYNIAKNELLHRLSIISN